MDQIVPSGVAGRHLPAQLVPAPVRRALAWMPAPPSLPFLFGVGVGVSYTTFVVIASRFYAGHYSPLNNNTLSQLGNVTLNPGGYSYYLAGCAIAGVFAMAFFVSLSPWRRTGSALQNRLLLAVQGLGIIGGFALCMNAAFPENDPFMHHLWASCVFNSVGLALLLSPLALRRPGGPNFSTTTCGLVGAASVIVMLVLAHDHWAEWLPVSTFLVIPAVLGFHTRRVAGNGGRP